MDKKNTLIAFVLVILLTIPLPLFAQANSDQEDGVTINNTPATSITVEFGKNNDGTKSLDSSYSTTSDWIVLVDIAYDSSLDFDYIFSNNAEAEAYTDVTCIDPFENVKATIVNHLIL